MKKYQVTALFGNVFEIVGADEVDAPEAYRLLRLMSNAGRKVRIHEITGSSSRIVEEA